MANGPIVFRALHAHRGRRRSKHQRARFSRAHARAAEIGRSRHELATTTIGLVIALAFALAAESFKDATKPDFLSDQPKPPGWTWPWHVQECSLLAASFLCTALGFFVGTQMWMWYMSGRKDVGTARWLGDFGATLVTGIVLVALGVATTPEMLIGFVVLQVILHGWNALWAIAARPGSSGRRPASTHPISTFVLNAWIATNATIGLCLLASVAAWHAVPSSISERALVLILFASQAIHLVVDLYLATRLDRERA